MECTEEEKAERTKMQAAAQANMADKMLADNANRAAELEKAKQQSMIDKASKKK